MSDDDIPVSQGDAFIVLATALPELMTDTGVVFDQQQQSGTWNTDSIALASQRLTELAQGEAVAGSKTVQALLRAMGANYDALSDVDGGDSERLETLRELFMMAPAMVLNCNNVSADMEAVGALVTHLQDPAWPVDLSGSDAEIISIELLSKQATDEAGTEGEGESAGVETYPLVADVDLTVALATDINPILREAFMSEMPDRVREFSDCVGQLVAGTGDDEVLFAAQRAAHTIKGSAHVSGVTAMGWLTHLSEDIVEYITGSKTSEAPEGTYDLLQSTSDCLECMVEHLQGLGPYPDDAASVYTDLREMYLSMSSEGSECDAESTPGEVELTELENPFPPSSEADLRLADLQASDNAIASAHFEDESLVSSSDELASTDDSFIEATVQDSSEVDKPDTVSNTEAAVEDSQLSDSQIVQSQHYGTESDAIDASVMAQDESPVQTESELTESDEDAVEEPAPTGVDLAFISLASALPDLMADTGLVFDQQHEKGEWDNDSIEAASQRVTQLAQDESVAESKAAVTILSAMGANYDALSGVGSDDSERLQMLRELFTMAPAMTLNCSNVCADMEAVGALVTHLQDPAWPIELSDSDAEAISIELLSDQSQDSSEVREDDLVVEETFPAVGEVDLTVALSADINPMLRGAFMSEMPDRVREFSDCVGQLVAGTGDDEVLFAAQRAAHTIKGSAHVSGVTGMGWLTHLCEDIVEIITESKTSEIPDGTYDLLQTTSDCLECMVEHLQGVSPYPEETASTYSKLREMYLSMTSGTEPDLDLGSQPGQRLASNDAIIEPVGEASEPSAPQIAADVDADTDSSKSVTVAATPERRPSKARVQQEKQSVDLTEKSIHLSIRQLKSLQNLAGDISIHNVRMGGFSGDATQALSDLSRQQGIVQQRLEDLTTLLMYQGVQSNVAKPEQTDDDFDSLEMDQYTELHSAASLAYEAVIDAQEMTSNIQRQVKSFGEILADNGRVSRDFNNDISNIRMVTSAELAPRLQRVARQTAKATGKTVELVIEGENVEFDRDLYNPLADALLHAIRNSIDHGIEPPTERLARDKPETGTVTIRLERDAGDIMISCHDDGGGLDFEAIRKKAVSKNQIKTDDEPTEAELAQLIFTPGFSTRQDVSQISGRGMGMNIVFEAIRTRHGSVDIESDATNGTTVRMRMPMSLMSMHLIIAKYGDETYAIPSNSVEQLVLSDMGEVETRDAADGGKEKVFSMGDGEWKIFALGSLLGSDTKANATTGDNDSFPLVLLKTPQGNYAVRLRHASHSGVMVVKSFGDYIERVNGILGGAILADGSVCPVLDLAELAVYQREALRTSRLHDTSDFVVQDDEFVLVVDDSLSARRTLVQLLVDAGFETREARDGIDAIEVLDKATPKVLITDLEMPRMNGVELVQHIRARDTNNDFPIVMVTSRSTAKHKSRAMEAGVTDYVTKPWDEDKLVDLVSSYLVNKLADVA